MSFRVPEEKVQFLLPLRHRTMFMNYFSCVHARPNESSTDECFVPAISHNHERCVLISHSNVADKLVGEYCGLAVAPSVLFALVLVVFHVAVDKMWPSTNCSIDVSVTWP